MIRHRSRIRPTFGPLEGRALLASLMVTADVDSGPGSLRRAILDADAATGPSTIGFDLPGSGPMTLHLASALPAITRPVTIDGSTQPGYAGSPLIDIEGSAITSQFPDGLDFDQGSTGGAVRGLGITGFQAGIGVLGSSVSIQFNALGVHPDGSPGGGNGAGIILFGPTQGTGSVIEGNSIGNNLDGIDLDSATDAVVRDNFIGTDPAGSAVFPNSNDGILATSGTTARITGNLIANSGRLAIEDQTGGGLTLSGNTLTNNGTELADLAVAVSTTSIAAQTGQSVTVTYTVTNQGPASATDARLSLGEPASLTGDGTTGVPSAIYRIAGAIASQGKVETVGAGTFDAADLGTIAPGGSATVTLTIAIIGSGGDALNSMVSSGQSSTLHAPFTVATSTEINATGTADLAVSVIGAHSPGQAGIPETFTFLVTNADRSSSTHALLALTFGSTAGIAGLGVVTTGGTVMALPGVANGFDGDLYTIAPGASVILTATIVPTRGGVVSATAFAYSTADVDPDIANNLAFAAAVIPPPPPVALGLTLLPTTGPIAAIAVYFDSPLNPAQARVVANYRLTATGSASRVALKSAVYDPSTNAVTLRLSRPLPRRSGLIRLALGGPGTPGLDGADGVPVASVFIVPFVVPLV